MPASAELSALMDRAVAIVSDAPPEEKMERFNDACHVLGRLVGGGSITFDEARALALELGCQVRFAPDSIEDLVVICINEGKKIPAKGR